MVRLGERAKEAIIIVEGIYSMLGDVSRWQKLLISNVVSVVI